ncbi:hypothetical protein Tco_0727545 [Tanacetum coccineum]|uniref:Uncharacterized protein n=1 Tax=Tanacetum coccineum TaxID=301880 RepID=A0ABQ4YIM6_9ASTR
MDEQNMTMEEYIKLEEEKAHRRGRLFNWQTATYRKIRVDDDLYNLRSVETEFPTIVFNDMLSSEATLSCEPTVSSLNDNEINFRVLFDESDDEDYTVSFDKNSFSYKIIYVNDLKTDSKNDNEKVNMPSFPSPEPTVNFLTESTLSPSHIDEFDLKDETSLSEFDEEEQNIFYFNDLFSFNVIYLDDSKTDKDDDDDKIDIEHSSGDMSVIPLSNVSIRRILGNEYGVSSSYTILGPRERKSTNIGGEFTNLEILKCWSLKTSRRVLYKVEDIATYLVEYVKFWDDWEVDRYGNANLGFDSNKEEVVPKVDDVSLVDGVFDRAFGGDGEEDFVMGEGMVLASSSLEMLTKSCLGGIMLGLEEGWSTAQKIRYLRDEFSELAQSPSHEVRRMQERDSSERRKDLFNAQNFKEIVWSEFLMISVKA